MAQVHVGPVSKRLLDEQCPSQRIHTSDPQSRKFAKPENGVCSC